MGHAVAMAARARGWFCVAVGRPFAVLNEALAAWGAAERGRFALWLPVFMGAGTIADLSARTEPVWWLGAAPAAAGTLLALLARRHPLPRGVACALAACGSACCRHRPRPGTPRRRSPCRVAPRS